MSKMIEINGDLFSSNTNLAHCVSSDFVMGAGIAKSFKEKYGSVQKLKMQNKDVGECAFLEHDNKKIYYLVTKRNFYDKPTYNSMKQSLVSMKKLIKEHQVQEIAIPLIGCGLDRLNWNKVKQIILDVFCNTNLKIFVYKK